MSFAFRCDFAYQNIASLNFSTDESDTCFVQLAERRIFPAIDIELSGTRKEELLIGEEMVNRIYTLRRVLARMPSLDAMPLLIDRLMKTDSNAEFLDSFRVDE